MSRPERVEGYTLTAEGLAAVGPRVGPSTVANVEPVDADVRFAPTAAGLAALAAWPASRVRLVPVRGADGRLLGTEEAR